MSANTTVRRHKRCRTLAGHIGKWAVILSVYSLMLPDVVLSQQPSATAVEADAVIVKGANQTRAFPARRVDIDLRRRTRSPAAAWQPGQPIKEIPKRQNTEPVLTDREPARVPPSVPDPLLERQTRSPSIQQLRSFGNPTLVGDAGFAGANPPDAVGDIGGQFYIHMTNSPSGAIFTVYDAQSHTVIAGPTALDTLGAGNCAQGLGDPIVLYDHLADRWLLSEFSNVADSLCVYVSAGPDPTMDGFFAYEFAAANGFPDYPKYAVWPDAYYMSSNESNPTVYAFERAAMLTGQPARIQFFNAASLSGFGFQSLQPSDLDGQAPLDGTPVIFLRHRDDEVHDSMNNDPARDFLEVFEFRSDFNNPVNATFTGPFRIPMTEFDSTLCGLTSFSCFPQPGAGGPALDPLREVVMWRVQYRRFADHDSAIGSMVTDVDGTDRGGIRWFELRRDATSGWRLFQEGTYSPSDGHNRFMPSIAMDRVGNIALGYSIVSGSLSAGIRYTGRLASDPTGTMPRGEVIIADGIGSSASNRWGDYSAMSVDPREGCTFWYTNQFANSGLYNTRVSELSFSQCAAFVRNSTSVRFLVDLNKNQRADYCRFVGIEPHIALSCVLADDLGYAGNYDFNSQPGFAGLDPGYRERPRFMADVNGDGRADYCRFVGVDPTIALSCALATASGFGNYDFNSQGGLASFDPGYAELPPGW